ncbi:MAG: hypothetical protein E7488_03945 [Ruminococcaceae bacterium]|nr:hypothetical protein [Oscillospiraceae bacterium]
MLYEQYKKQALSDLKNYNDLKSGIKALSQRIQFLKRNDLYSGVGTREKVMKSCDGDSLMIHHLSQLEAMEKQLRYNKIYVSNIDNALAMLSAKDRDILTSFYINRQRRSVTKLAEETFSDRSWLYRKAQKALERYIEIFFGAVKDNL